MLPDGNMLPENWYLDIIDYSIYQSQVHYINTLVCVLQNTTPASKVHAGTGLLATNQEEEIMCANALVITWEEPA